MKEFAGAMVVAVLLLAQPEAGAASWEFMPVAQGAERGPAYKGADRRAPPRHPPGQRGARPGPERNDAYAGRLTEQERRELRRDVDRANREIYRQRPPGR